jgi:hypothetical protein
MRRGILARNLGLMVAAGVVIAAKNQPASVDAYVRRERETA